MATWDDFRRNAPEMAEQGRVLLYVHGVGLGYLATVRADGGPRVHPVCPVIAEGRLWTVVNPGSPKYRDLIREGRYALHSFSAADSDDEFYVTGAAMREHDTAVRAAVVAASAATGVSTGDHDELFHLEVDRAMVASYAFRGQWPPVYAKWKAPAASP
jgi:hypothetical protein